MCQFIFEFFTINLRDRYCPILKNPFLPLIGLCIFIGSFSYTSYCDQGVLGTDDRELVEFDAFRTEGSQFLGALSINDRVNCSAVLVGPTHIATAAHCLRKAVDVTDVRFHLHLQNGKSKISSKVVKWETLPFFPNQASENDWAVLKLSRSLGIIYGWVEPSTEKIPVGTRLRSFGYPGDLADENGAKRAVYVPECQVLPQGDTITEAGRMDCDINYGSSGGPVLAEMPSSNRSKKQYYLAGLNVRLDLTDSGFNEFTEGATFYKSWVGAVVQATLRDVLTRVIELDKREKNTPREFLDAMEWAKGLVEHVKVTEFEIEDYRDAELAVEMFRLFSILDETMLIEMIPARSGAEFSDVFKPLVVESVRPGSFAEEAGLVRGDQLVKFIGSEKLDEIPLNKMGLRAVQFLAQGGPLHIEVYNRDTNKTRLVKLKSKILEKNEHDRELAEIERRYIKQYEKLQRIANRF